MMSDQQNTILILGNRLAPAKACLKLGLRPVVIENPDEQCVDDYKNKNITHILASSEKTVLMALDWRKHLGLDDEDDSYYLALRDKWVMKNLARNFDIACTDYRDGQENLDILELQNRWGKKIVVKERMNSGSRGLFIGEDAKEIQSHCGKGKIVEAFVDAQEASVESFIHQGKIVFSNITHYIKAGHINFLPAHFEQEETQAILKLNELVIKAFNIKKGMTHLEVYRTSSGPLFGEVAIRPPGGHIMELIKRSYGFDPWMAWVACETGVALKRDYFRLPTLYSSVIVIHPGEGEVKKIEGIEAIRGLPELQRLKIKVDVGDQVLRRLGTGEEIGHVVLTSQNAKQLMESIEFVRANLKVVLK